MPLACYVVESRNSTWWGVRARYMHVLDTCTFFISAQPDPLTPFASCLYILKAVSTFAPSLFI